MMGPNTLIVSPKKEGNTYKVAAHLKANADADLLILEGGEACDLQKYDHIVLCSGVYGDKLHSALSGWLKRTERERFKQDVRFHVFLTWFGRGASDQRAMAEAARLLAEKGFGCDENYGSCFGGKFIIRKGHPDTGDRSKALAWLKQKI